MNPEPKVFSMNVKIFQKTILNVALLMILLATAGCMARPHHGQGGSAQEHTHVDDSTDVGAEKGTGSEKNGSTSRAEKEVVSLLAAHHGLVDPHSSWTWLAGGGMVLMMVLMVL
jgi:hypothetical protein